MGYTNLLWPIEGHGFYDIKDNNYLIHIKWSKNLKKDYQKLSLDFFECGYARNRIGKEMAAEYLEQVSKKRRETQSAGTVYAESEFGRFCLRPCKILFKTKRTDIYTWLSVYSCICLH